MMQQRHYISLQFLQCGTHKVCPGSPTTCINYVYGTIKKYCHIYCVTWNALNHWPLGVALRTRNNFIFQVGVTDYWLCQKGLSCDIPSQIQNSRWTTTSCKFRKSSKGTAGWHQKLFPHSEINVRFNSRTTATLRNEVQNWLYSTISQLSHKCDCYLRNQKKVDEMCSESNALHSLVVKVAARQRKPLIAWKTKNRHYKIRACINQPEAILPYKRKAAASMLKPIPQLYWNTSSFLLLIGAVFLPQVSSVHESCRSPWWAYVTKRSPDSV